MNDKYPITSIFFLFFILSNHMQWKKIHFWIWNELLWIRSCQNQSDCNFLTTIWKIVNIPIPTYVVHSSSVKVVSLEFCLLLVLSATKKVFHQFTTTSGKLPDCAAESASLCLSLLLVSITQKMPNKCLQNTLRARFTLSQK